MFVLSIVFFTADCVPAVLSVPLIEKAEHQIERVFFLVSFYVDFGSSY